MILLLKKQTEPNVKNKILYLIQAWAHAFRNEPKYKVVQDTYQIMKVEGKQGPGAADVEDCLCPALMSRWIDSGDYAF